MGAMRIISYGKTDTGRVRDHNEDSFVVDPGIGFFLVADGVGGGNAGEVASSMLVERLHDAMARFEERELPLEKRLPMLQELLPRSIQAASEQIFKRAQEEPGYRGMATTAVCVKLAGDHAVVAHVGDSRLYLVRKGRIYQITQDHSLAQALMQRGVLKEEDLPSFRYKHVILRSVGLQPTVEVDTVVLELLPGDVMVLCSDGLSDLVPAPRIEEVVQSMAPKEAVETLIGAANEAGGVDNVTVIVLKAMGTPPPSQVMATEQKASVLAGVFLFRDLSFAETLKVMQCVHEHRYQAGEYILRQGEEGDRFYVVTQGTVQVVKDGIPLTVIGRGGHFGELSLLETGVRSADVVALEDSVLLSIPQDEFFELLKADHTLATKLLWRFLQNLGRRVIELSDRLSHLMRDDM